MENSFNTKIIVIYIKTILNYAGSKFRGSWFKVRQMKEVYEQARRTRAAVRGFIIKYLKKYEERKKANREPDNLNNYDSPNCSSAH